MRRFCLFRVLGVLCCLSLPLIIFSRGQASDGSEAVALDSLRVENLYLDVQLAFERQTVPDSSVLEVYRDAEQALKKRNWLEAEVLFELVLDVLADSERTGPAGTVTSPSRVTRRITQVNLLPAEKASWQLRSEIGFDYSVQNFQANLLGVDSTFSEQYRLPYWGILLDQHLSRQLTLSHRLRVNRELIDYSVVGSRIVESGGWQQRMEIEGEFYRLADLSNITQLDLRGRYALFGSRSLSRAVRLDVQLRRKWTLTASADSIYGNLWFGQAVLTYEGRFHFDHQLGLEFTPEYYQEDQVLGQNYQQLSGKVYYRFYRSFNRNVELDLEVAYRRFESQLNGEGYRNRYVALRPSLTAEWSLGTGVGVATDLTYEQRRHQEPSEVSPDFRNGKARSLLKIYWGEFKSVGLGLVGEKQTHTATTETAQNFVQQADFNARGLVADLEIMQTTGTLVNLSYELEWRDYPNASVSLFDTFYSNRLIHTLTGFAWIPIRQRWQFQIFANYTNDLDREKEHNDSNNIVFSVGLIYTF